MAVMRSPVSGSSSRQRGLQPRQRRRILRGGIFAACSACAVRSSIRSWKVKRHSLRLPRVGATKPGVDQAGDDACATGPAWPATRRRVKVAAAASGRVTSCARARAGAAAGRPCAGAAARFAPLRSLAAGRRRLPPACVRLDHHRGAAARRLLAQAGAQRFHQVDDLRRARLLRRARTPPPACRRSSRRWRRGCAASPRRRTASGRRRPARSGRSAAAPAAVRCRDTDTGSMFRSFSERTSSAYSSCCSTRPSSTGRTCTTYCFDLPGPLGQRAAAALAHRLGEQRVRLAAALVGREQVGLVVVQRVDRFLGNEGHDLDRRAAGLLERLQLLRR